MTIIEDGGIPAFLALCNSPDLMSQYYVGCALGIYIHTHIHTYIYTNTYILYIHTLYTIHSQPIM
jgi:hypothetical protein